MTIAFIHPHKAFLPDIEAYRDFFSGFSINTIVVHPNDLASLRADVEWHFLGFHTSHKNNGIVIHEYASASIPPFAAWKDLCKKWMNCRPGYRLFYSPYVRDRFSFHDDVPSGILDYGIYPASIEDAAAVEKRFDFIYVGTTERSRNLDPLFESFATGAMKDRSLLALSRDYEETARQLQAYPNIFFKGPVSAGDVYPYIRQARFGINFIPDKVPFNRQTSAKFMDYLACRVPVVTTDYAWMRNFQSEYGGDYFYADKDLSNFTWENVTSHPFTFPDLNELTWDKQIRRSGVLEFLSGSFRGLHF